MNEELLNFIPCKFNHSVDCFECADCHNCGWNPDVAAERIEKWKEEHKNV